MIVIDYESPRYFLFWELCRSGHASICYYHSSSRHHHVIIGEFLNGPCVLFFGKKFTGHNTIILSSFIHLAEFVMGVCCR